MPFRDDLIERTIEQLSQILSRMILHQTSYAELETFVQHTYQKYTGINGSLLRQLSSQDILNTLSTTGQLDKEKAYLLAALLEAESVLQTTDIGLSLKALDLYLEAALADVGIEDIHQRIENLNKTLEAFVLPELSEWRLFRYEIMQHDFAKAENRLYDLKDRLGTENVKPRALEFYTILQSLDDETLLRGGLSREEVSAGIKEFEA